MSAFGEQLAARKAELTDDSQSNGIPPPQLKTMETASVRRGLRLLIVGKRIEQA